MPVKAISEYKFPSKSRQELYGDDQLVHVWWKDNPWFCAAACFRAPRAMPWSDFWSALVVPFFEEDPDWSPDQQFAFSIDGTPVEPKATDTFADIGLVHKGVLAMVRA
ncbi:MAG: phenol hydroxylase [Tetrasphaera sp.]|jgi:phenol hydroxylase P4 protein|nr:phenol hydroxylase [Tetrasphaera sp.]